MHFAGHDSNALVMGSATKQRISLTIGDHRALPPSGVVKLGSSTAWKEQEGVYSTLRLSSVSIPHQAYRAPQPHNSSHAVSLPDDLCHLSCL